ncbi:MAG: hypothetical protein ACTSXG_04155 [Alphaproteobacteria bacterium]
MIIRTFSLVVIFFLCGCESDSLIETLKSIFQLKPSKVWVEKVHFIASEDLNNSSPVSVDIIVIYNEKLKDVFLGMDSETYFKTKEQKKKDYGSDIEIFNWDIVPGQHLKNQIIKLSKASGVSAIIFARYEPIQLPTAVPKSELFSEKHRAVIGGEQEITVQLKRFDFFVEPKKKK